jgi:nitrogen-specific signal transduction histidine kinase
MFEKWVDIDLNPFLSFDENGKILYSNAEAQYLLNKVRPKVLYDLAIQYAPKSYGVQTTYINLNLGNYLLYALSVGYENDHEICIKLYKSSQPKKEKKLSNNAQMTNLFSIIDLSISTNKMRSKANFLKYYDPSIPDFKIVINDLIKTLNYVYDICNQCDTISTKVRYKTGEYIKVDNKKRPLICIDITYESSKSIPSLTSIEDFAQNIDALIEIKDNIVSINLPLILE